jgi:hypothetical protein
MSVAAGRQAKIPDTPRELLEHGYRLRGQAQEAGPAVLSAAGGHLPGIVIS